MLFLILCIVINGLIGVLFKLFGKYDINLFNAIMINYIVCIMSGIVYTQNLGLISEIFHSTYLWVSMLMGFLFVAIFNIYALAVQQSGVGIATIFQKMSLVAPVIAAIVFYNEPFSLLKLSGIVFAIIALFLLSIKKNYKNSIRFGLKYLLIVFVGSCIIDLVLYLVEKESIAPKADLGFVTSIFLFAFIFGLIFHLYQRWTKKNSKFKINDLIGGLMLGIPNYLSIYLLLKVISMGWDGSIVFPANNVGVLLIATLSGIVFFKEEVTSRKLIGFLLAIGAIVMLGLA